MRKHEVRFMFALLFFIASHVHELTRVPMSIAAWGFFMLGVMEWISSKRP
jgi:hypothetical protein